jgi:hypothetical protein
VERRQYGFGAMEEIALTGKGPPLGPFAACFAYPAFRRAVLTELLPDMLMPTGGTSRKAPH